MRTDTTILPGLRSALRVGVCLLLMVPAYAVDTLTVAPQPDPFAEAWRWTEISLPGPVYDIFEDRDGNVWFATSVGAVRYVRSFLRAVPARLLEGKRACCAAMTSALEGNPEP